MATSLPNSGDGCFQKCLSLGSDDNDGAPIPIQYPLQNGNSDTTHQVMKQSEDFLASELSKLSVQERSQALDDLHCVGEGLQETPEIINNSLYDLDRILTERKDPIYDFAVNQSQAYVEDVNFRMRFLRANHHNAEKAAQQMISFLTQKEIYFGRDKIGKEISLDDLNEEDRNLLLSGRFHIQDGLDRNGRVVVYFLNHDLHLSNDSTMRANYFVFFNILSPLPSVQSKGVVVCYYDMSQPGSSVQLPAMHRILRFSQFQATVPIRRTGMHFCLKANPGSLLSHNLLLEKIFRGLRQSARVRARVHYGSDMELQYKLRGHGLPMENAPINTNGEIRTDILNVWFHRYVAKEWNESLVAGRDPSNAMGDELGLVEPTDKDVLLGRGRGIQMHPGNVRFREILKEYQEEYNNTPRFKRVDTPRELTRRFLEDGVRFLQKTQDGAGWVESSVAEVEKKVKQLFRTRKKIMTKAGL